MQPIIVHSPSSPAIPLVCDSPHSGTAYPDDFGHAIDRAALRRSEDTHVDRLWGRVPTVGGTLVCATFPRSYIDPNRHESDLDVSMIDGAWPHAVGPRSRASELGMSLVWRRTPEHRDIYARKLAAAEVRRRIEQFWRPYRDAVTREIEAARARHGACWHLNLHSMPSNVYERLGLPARPAADIVLGDRRGTTCEPAFTALLQAAFRAQGLGVAVNDPYQGAELVRMHGDPARGRHSLQIEINRALYMDEATREPSAGFGALQAAIDAVLVQVAGYVAQRASLPPATSWSAGRPLESRG
jgi:N-formylglutamate deformylase